ncbi:MAG: hypothetical protein WCJ04_03865 [Actinomycetes bacterium]
MVSSSAADDGGDVASLALEPAVSAAPAAPAADSSFEMLYPMAVGIARRILDRNGQDLDESLVSAEEVVRGVFLQLRLPLSEDSRSLAKICALVADGCLDLLVGAQSLVSVPSELLPSETGFLGKLPLYELQITLGDMRKVDRRVGLLVFAAGLSPSQAAIVLALGVDSALRSINRIERRLQDRQVLGLGPKFETVRS